MTKYINKTIYTDVQSWKVFGFNEDETEAYAIEVEKKIRPTAIVGGFSAVHPNLHEEFANAKVTVKEGATPFKITKGKDGVWGFKTFKTVAIMPCKAIAKDWIEQNKNNPAVEVGDEFVTVYELTPKGKKKTIFEKLGKLSDVCGYFYDFNF